MSGGCLVCDREPTPRGRPWCGKAHRAALRALGRSLYPDASGAAALQAAVEHRTVLAAMGVEFPTELVPAATLPPISRQEQRRGHR